MLMHQFGCHLSTWKRIVQIKSESNDMKMGRLISPRVLYRAGGIHLFHIGRITRQFFQG